ncbi:S49 family peptidase [Stenotrophomonas nitritireducens]|uniref:Peptidase S49 n=1 Tax=Stenotrophomonas nitritireducens TaxID=83617 RepID=A0ABR5NFT0_9GAMM|nr:S49 family peptidase [Stenotrophomonas nitritireducens]KRG54104.1 peptidase S49 [Stenotrophomonas nitritireducens]
MTSKPGLLARLLNRGNKAPVVATLAAAVLNQPLLVQPAIGEALVGGYLEGKITSADSELRADRFEVTGSAGETVGVTQSVIGVINLSGAMVNRPMPGASGPGPVSYAAIRTAFDELLEDDAVTAIILRLDTPGGMASGCFDLVDHIYQARGRKPLYALVDDYAASAGFALASPCDEIWVSRTGTVGSVGVVAYHYDWSGNNAQIGLKVTPLYAGARKVDFNPNFPLSEEAHAQALADLEDMRTLFVDTVARNLGMEADAVRATEAATYRGQAAVDIGFATRLGTWHDLIAHLGAGGTPAPAAAGDDADDGDPEANASAKSAFSLLGDEFKVIAEKSGTQPAAAASASAAAPAEQPSLAATVAASDLPATICMALLRRGEKLGEESAAALEYANGVLDACAATVAGGEALAASFIEKNTDLDTVRTQLLSMKAEEGRNSQVITAHPASTAETRAAEVKAKLDPTNIYKNRGN